LFVAVFAWSYFDRRSAPPVAKAKPAITVGSYDRYAFVISQYPGQAERALEIHPAVIDDTTAIEVMRRVMQVAYGTGKEDVQPVVQDIGERHYLTFSVDGTTTIFQLIRDSKGFVESATFRR
jgi:hypothetical protein